VQQTRQCSISCT